MQAEKTTERKAYKQKDKGIYERVGKALQRQRERLGLKATQVANDRISATIVAKMEKGEALTLDNLSTIARQLKTSLASIFAEADQIREPAPSVSGTIDLKVVEMKGVTDAGEAFVLRYNGSVDEAAKYDLNDLLDRVTKSLAGSYVILPAGFDIVFVEEADVPTDAEPDACAECEGEGCPACDDDGDQFGR